MPMPHRPCAQGLLRDGGATTSARRRGRTLPLPGNAPCCPSCHVSSGVFNLEPSVRGFHNLDAFENDRSGLLQEVLCFVSLHFSVVPPGVAIHIFA